MFIKLIHPTNVLSFDEETPPIPLAGLTALCGPNNAGKTNLLRIINAIGQSKWS